MSKRGSNLPGFRAAQIDFAAHIRNPEIHPRPADVEQRRMRIYLRLFYNNIENFLASAFPVAKRVLGDTTWHEVVRKFVHRHPSTSPYFLEISQEFLSFLDDRLPEGLPDFLLELCHYEWVELYLGMSADEIATSGVDPAGDLKTEEVVLSPLLKVLSYRYPVHRISPEYQPLEPPDDATHLVVYRKRNDKVHFLESNTVTHRLLQVLEEPLSGSRALELLANELSGVDRQIVTEQGAAILEQLRDTEIILGTRLKQADS
ncbi:MAG: putative DNA-binding domain-containing protein [Gammaproteobacteria bacterium]|nr:putative DNA-binding domain-containing protein [Gammaproteobacteria bacterium]